MQARPRLLRAATRHPRSSALAPYALDTLRAATLMSDPWLIVGLGNPGPEYAATRHNIGSMAVDVIAGSTSATLSRHKKVHARIAETHLGFPGDRVSVIACAPLSYMNESGGPVKAAMNFYTQFVWDSMDTACKYIVYELLTHLKNKRQLVLTARSYFNRLTTIQDAHQRPSLLSNLLRPPLL